jgi:hypothetical protein
LAIDFVVIGDFIDVFDTISLNENSGKGKIGKPSAVFGKKLRRLF